MAIDRALTVNVLKTYRRERLSGNFEGHFTSEPPRNPSRNEMSLVISSRLVSGVIIADITGRLCFLDVTLRERVNEWLKEGHREFVFNLENVPYADSFGLSQLIIIWTSIRNIGGRLILLRPTDHVQALLRITKLNTVFNISAEEALAVSDLKLSPTLP